MLRLVAVAIIVVAVCGCASQSYWIDARGPNAPVVQAVVTRYDNPMFLPIADRECAWETVVDVVDDYLQIRREDPVRLLGDTLTEGELETYTRVGATIFEPWRDDSADRRERIESTLQSIRRWAVVRVIPAQGGYWVDVAVFKELEDVVRPEHAAAGSATFRFDDTLTRVVNPVGDQEVNEGWIPQGRDAALEQRMLAHLQQRVVGGGR